MTRCYNMFISWVHDVRNKLKIQMKFRFLEPASLEPPLLLPRPWLVTPLMATQFMAMPQTLLDQLWSLAGQRLLRRQPTWVTSPTTAPLTLLAPATWTRPTATPSLTEPMATSWSRTTTTCHTIMQDPRRLPSVDLPHKNPIQIFNILLFYYAGSKVAKICGFTLQTYSI